MTERNLDIVASHSPTDDAMTPFARMLALQLRSGRALMTESVPHMADRILRALGPGLKIRRLRIFGHGNVAVQNVGRLQYSRTFPDGSFHLNHADSTRLIMCQVVDQVHPDGHTVQTARWLNERDLRRLQGRFADGGWVELHGCYVARGARGRTFVSQLAQLWSVTVKAGEIPQHAGGGFEGRVTIARPNGRVYYE